MPLSLYYFSNLLCGDFVCMVIDPHRFHLGISFHKIYTRNLQERICQYAYTALAMNGRNRES